MTDPAGKRAKQVAAETKEVLEYLRTTRRVPKDLIEDVGFQDIVEAVVDWMTP